MAPVKTLLIDNYDSYTYNLYQHLAIVNGGLPDVIYNDQYSCEGLLKYIEEHDYDNIVISPGPGSPHNSRDVGLCVHLIRSNVGVPILGVCLGMQAIGHAYGAAVGPAPEPVHGRLSQIRHDGHPLFSGIPSGEGYEVVRYHSLVVDEISLPSQLKAIAWTAAASHHALNVPSKGQGGSDNISSLVMGLAHVSRPLYGVQYHPESVATQYGKRLLANFRDLTRGLRPMLSKCPSALPEDGQRHPSFQKPSRSRTDVEISLDLRWECLTGLLPLVGGTERLFTSLFGCNSNQSVFWLDSASKERCRFSFMGGRGGPLWKHIRFRLPQGSPAGACKDSTPGASLDSCKGATQESPAGATQDCLAGASVKPGTVEVEDANGQLTTLQTPFWQYLEAGLVRYRFVEAMAGQELPFDFWGGYVGYLGYQLKAECGSPNIHQSSCPDACLFLCDRFLAVDQEENNIYVVAISETDNPTALASAEAWLASIAACVRSLQTSTANPQPSLYEAHAPSHSGNGGVHSDGAATAAQPPASRVNGNLHSQLPRSGDRPSRQLANGTSHANLSVKNSQVPTDPQEAKLQCSQATRSSANESGMASARPPAEESTPVGVLNGSASPQERLGSAREAPPDDVPASENTSPCAVHTAGPPRVVDVYSSNGCTNGQILSKDEQRECLHNGCHYSGLAHGGECRGAMLHGRADGRDEDMPKGSCASTGLQAENALELQQAGETVRRFKLLTSRQQYLENVEACLAYLHAGESYEMCLTTMMVREGAPDALHLYHHLRRTNPAPYAAFLSFGTGGPQICCSSPERFLRGGRLGEMEAAPIKGTAKRHSDPEQDKALAAGLAASEKDRAENLMIVDLLRNDLGRVCQVGSVTVTSLMEVETYATVHQLVSRVAGKRVPGVSPVDCIRAAFPGGSMTGAPKLRSVELLDMLEPAARGVYSGSIGYLSFNGAFDFNIVIRTAVIYDDKISIGAGGAIVVQSDPEAEYAEMRLKASALLRAVGLCDGNKGPGLVNDSEAGLQQASIIDS